MCFDHGVRVFNKGGKVIMGMWCQGFGIPEFCSLLTTLSMSFSSQAPKPDILTQGFGTTSCVSPDSRCGFNVDRTPFTPRLWKDTLA